jgi:hypothetical protein
MWHHRNAWQIPQRTLIDQQLAVIGFFQGFEIQNLIGQAYTYDFTLFEQ